MSPLSRVKPRIPISLIASAVAIACTLLGTAQAPASPPAETLSVYRSAVNPGSIGAYESWINHPVAYAMDYFEASRWEKIESPSWWLEGWSRSPYRDRMIYSVPIVPDAGGTLGAGAGGAYNEHFRRLAQNLVAHGQEEAVLRLGWEFNGDWYRWSAAREPWAYAAYWRQIVTTMRRVPGARFRFEWTPVLGTQKVAPERAYPGDAYVDYIGLDAYDQDWLPGWQDPVKRWQNLLNQPHGLVWHRDFAAAHRKPMVFGEWGLIVRGDGHGGGDNPYYVQRMHEWIAANRVAYHVYFEASPPLTSGRLPRGAATFRALFGSSSSGPPSAPLAPGSNSAPAATPARAAAPARRKRARRCKRAKRRHATKVRRAAASKGKASTRRRTCRRRKRPSRSGGKPRPTARAPRQRGVTHQAERKGHAVHDVAGEQTARLLR